MSRSAPNTELYNIIGNAVDFSAITFDSNKKYTFYEPTWLYSLNALKLLELNNPQFDVETMFLRAPQRDIQSGAVQDPQYWVDRKYVRWVDENPASSTPVNITYTKTVNGNGNGVYFLSVPKFDTSLGILYKVRIQTKVIKRTAQFTAYNNTVSPAIFTPNVDFQDDIFFTNTPITATGNVVDPGGAITIAPAEGLNHSFDYHINIVRTTTDASTNLNNYMGDDTIDIEWDTANELHIAGSLSSEITYTEELELTATYTYRAVNNVVQQGFLPSAVDQNSLSLTNIKVSENTFIAPKFIPVFFVINNIKGKDSALWTLTDITDPQNPQLVVKIKGAPYFIWRFPEIGQFSLVCDVSDQNANSFLGEAVHIITVLAKDDYIKIVEDQLNTRKVGLI